MIIGTGMDNKEMLKPLLENSIPIAMIAREMPGHDVQTVITDDFAGGRLAAEHLLGLGHTRLAVLAEQLKVSSSRERIRGFRQRLAEAGIDLPDDRVLASGDAWSRTASAKRRSCCSGRNVRRRFFLLQRSACNRCAAGGEGARAPRAGAAVHCRLRQYDIGDGHRAPLTTVSQPTEEMGKLAVDLLLSQLKKEEGGSRRTVLQPELVTRRSTAAPSNE